ncbi:DUF4367 domain-containing protein [Paenibacillus antarcticus]|uniref:Uncharacterized protein n=1 Tax=Paenibacillus antarcticus TaxID=253703 RepID=A0A168QBA1_9BACL|nr:DUF4367 domain-containing protein [Paenibacillus antarcticus]OAB47591.1 hypothetical protein PBAT_05050 [Paenibacillus antarcticus]
MLKLVLLSFSMLISTGVSMNKHTQPKIEQLTKYTNFEIYAPSNLEAGIQYEIKVPSDVSQTKCTDLVLINYFNAKGSYVVGVRQQRNNAYMAQENIEFDVKNRTQTTKKVIRKVTLEPRGEAVSVDGSEGRYEAYLGTNASGGILKWVQSDTYIELDTSSLSKSSLIEIAESMKKVNN